MEKKKYLSSLICEMYANNSFLYRKNKKELADKEISYPAFKEWFLCRTNGEELYHAWIKGGCKKSEKPILIKKDLSLGIVHGNISISIMGTADQKRGKRVRCIDTGEIFPSATLAARRMGAKNPSGISRACNGHIESIYGKRWRFEQ